MSEPTRVQSETPVPVWRDASVLQIHGGTAAEFLQGYLTCDTQRINTETATPMAICNIKGRVLASGWAIGLTEGGVALIVHTSLVHAVEAFLKPYLTFSQCTLADSDRYCITTTDSPVGVELIAGLYATLDRIQPGQTIDVSPEMTIKLVAAHFAFVSAVVSERFLPQMLNLDDQGAVDFDKGCYLGQEIVARAEFRGAVKRKLTQFSWQEGNPVIGDGWQEKGTVIAIADNHTGLILSKIS